MFFGHFCLSGWNSNFDLNFFGLSMIRIYPDDVCDQVKVPPTPVDSHAWPTTRMQIMDPPAALR